MCRSAQWRPPAPGGDEYRVGRAEVERGAIEILGEEASAIGRFVEVELGTPEGQRVLRIGDVVAHGGIAQAGPIVVPAGADDSGSWPAIEVNYVLDPWGNQLELVHYS